MILRMTRDDKAQAVRSHSPMGCGKGLDLFVTRIRPIAILLLTLLVAWTYLFLSVHELSHISEADSSGCKFALLASTVGGSSTAPALSLPAPSIQTTLAERPLLVRELLGEVSTQQARAPPVLA